MKYGIKWTNSMGTTWWYRLCGEDGSISNPNGHEARLATVATLFNTKNEARDLINKINSALPSYCRKSFWVEEVELYDLYEQKNLTIEDLRKGYRIITGLDNDKDFTNQGLYEYMLEALFEE